VEKNRKAPRSSRGSLRHDEVPPFEGIVGGALKAGRDERAASRSRQEREEVQHAIGPSC